MSSGERYVESGSARLWTTSSGAGLPIVFFNGGPGCDDYLEPVADLIADICQVVRFEPRGCGRSDWDGRYDLETFLADVEVVREAYGFGQWFVLGHSHGPNLALAYALRHPSRVLGLIGLAGGKVLNDRSWSEAYHENLATVGEDLGGKVFHADPLVNTLGNEAWKVFCRRPTLFRELADLATPCVFVNASEDIRPNWPTRQLAELIPGARYEEIDGAAHTIWLTHAEPLRDRLHAAVEWIRASAPLERRAASTDPATPA